MSARTWGFKSPSRYHTDLRLWPPYVSCGAIVAVDLLRGGCTLSAERTAVGLTVSLPFSDLKCGDCDSRRAEHSTWWDEEAGDQDHYFSVPVDASTEGEHKALMNQISLERKGRFNTPLPDHRGPTPHPGSRRVDSAGPRRRDGREPNRHRPV